MLLNLIKHHQTDIDKIYLYIKYLFESKYQFLINEKEKVGIENLKNPRAFLIIHNWCLWKFWDYCPTKKRKVLIAFDDMIADMESNEKFSPIVTELLLRGTKT